jgi:hypothetical protein
MADVAPICGDGKPGWLKAFSASARNWIDFPSAMRVFLMSARSMLLLLRPRIWEKRSGQVRRLLDELVSGSGFKTGRIEPAVDRTLSGTLHNVSRISVVEHVAPGQREAYLIGL